MRNWLIDIRKYQELTQRMVASMTGISRAYYAQIELCQRDPSIHVARRIALALGFEWTKFYEDDGNGSGHSPERRCLPGHKP